MPKLLAAALVAALHVSQPHQFLLTLARDMGPHHVPPKLVLVDSSGKLIRTIGTSGYVLVDGRWSPNGRSIAWSDPEGVHVEDADGTNQRLLVPHGQEQPSFIWTPDGVGLDVGGVGPEGNEFLYAPVDGATPSPLAAPKPEASYTPSFWTPGGNAFVWTSFTGVAGTASCCVYSVFETTSATHVTRTLYRTRNWHGLQAPLVSPNGAKRLMFDEAASPNEGYALRIVDNTTGRSRLLPVTDSTTFTAWSPDGRTVATVLGDDRVVEVAIATGKVRRIGSGQQLFYGRDGTLYVTRAGYSQVWTSTNGSPERFLFRTPGSLEVYALDAG